MGSVGQCGRARVWYGVVSVGSVGKRGECRPVRRV